MQPTHPCPARLAASLSSLTRWWQKQASGLLLCWQLWLGAYFVGFFFVFSSWLCCPLRFQNSPQTCLWEDFLLFGNFSFTAPSPGQVSIPNSFISVSVFCILSYLILKRMGYLLGAWCPPPVFRSCFVAVSQHSNDILMNLWREKVVSPSYSSAILGLPPSLHFKYHPQLKKKKKKGSWGWGKFNSGWWAGRAQ